MSLERDLSKVEIPPRAEFQAPAVDFVLRYANGLGIQGGRADGLRTVLNKSLDLVMSASRIGLAEQNILVEVGENEGRLLTKVHNRGLPLFQDTKESLPLQDQSRQLDKIFVENLGREGQVIGMEMRLERNPQSGTELNLDSSGSGQSPSELAGDLEFRELREGEETELSRLFYRVYQYQYINDYVYFPEKLRELRTSGKLISLVAAIGDRLVGHVGLYRWNETPPVYEACLGIVDPTVKSKGIFRRLFAKTMERVNSLPMQYCFFDFVTNHDLSQREVCSYGTKETALLVGYQTRTTQASLEKLGLGRDSKEMDRYSLLYSVYPRVEHPFGREVLLPDHLGEMLGFLLKPLNLVWSPTPRFDILPDGGTFKARYAPNQDQVVFEMTEPGREAVDRILEEWHELLRSGYQYAGVDIPLNYPGLGQIHDRLASHGFFVGGFLPWNHSERLAIRLQANGPTKVAFQDIKVFSPTAKALAQVVQTDCERNSLL